MTDPFEDHCWKDLMPSDMLEVYSHYRRDLFAGPSPALLAIDLYNLAYEGGSRPVPEVVKEFPSSCGENAWNALPPTIELFRAARRAGIPIFYSTMDMRKDARPSTVTATRRRSGQQSADAFEIKAEIKPEPGDIVITKQRASVFFGTPLIAHLAQLGVRSLIVCGESTSGCVRATAVDAYSYGFHVTMVEECCFDRNIVSHKANLFDLHHKYADVLSVSAVCAHLAQLAEAAGTKPRLAAAGA
jgi:nicotinamidase-related amidase